jgi:hypothetical protein
MDRSLADRLDDLAGLQASALVGGESMDVVHGEGRVDRAMTLDSMFGVWCLVKPISTGALIALAEQVADGLKTPLRTLSPTAADAGIDDTVTIDDVQSLSLKLDRTGLMEAICRDERDLRAQLVAELAEADVPVVPTGAFHSEYTLWRLIAECIETLAGRQPATALNTLLVNAGIDAQFSIESCSRLVDRLVDFFDGTAEQRTVLMHSRSGVLLSTWSMPLGGFTTSRALRDWATAMFFRDIAVAVDPVSELFPSPRAVEHAVRSVQDGTRAAALGMRCNSAGRLFSLGWLGLSGLFVDPVQGAAAAVLTNDLACDPQRIETISDLMIDATP